ncbi:hypothetical protein [Treponema endosymbiont of Eucomonympha sp.]|uniref:hypothetical protein n=1 Tax=Treponema endosymbiont of Eucomonympha sp. TaxID=1580831 RepID=UPI000750EF89|nr:hypothetical protein [Treponema endosymbiont of Eucomonympha sp.]
MNAAKRFLTGAAVAAGALGIGAGVFFACRQELSPGGQSGANGTERKADAARFNDGDYTFYFKNGREASGDCDGYSSDFGGKTTIYEWWRDDIFRALSIFSGRKSGGGSRAARAGGSR